MLAGANFKTSTLEHPVLEEFKELNSFPLQESLAAKSKSALQTLSWQLAFKPETDTAKRGTSNGFWTCRCR
jgi:hypothetical protein